MPARDTTPAHIRKRREARHTRLVGLGYADYADYLASPTWRDVRRRYVEQRPWICNVCGATEALQLHHKTYERVGTEEMDDLMPLCSPCHATVHELERRGEANLAFEGVIDAARALAGRELLSRQRADREQQQADHRDRIRAEMEALPFRERERRARHIAARRYVDISRDLFMLRRMEDRGKADQMRKYLDRIERKAYGPQHWAEGG